MARIPRRGGRTRAPHAPARCRRIGTTRPSAVIKQAQAGGEAAGYATVLQAALNPFGPALPRAPRRFGRPDPLQRHAAQGFARSITPPRCPRQLHPLRGARVRHVGDHERHHRCTADSSPTAAHSSPSRLCAQRAADGRADEHTRHSRVTHTTRSASARMARRTNRSSISPPLRAIPNMSSGGPAMRRSPASPGVRRSSARRPHLRSFSRGRRSRRSRGHPKQLAAIKRGGYVLIDSDGPPEVHRHRHRLRGRHCRRGGRAAPLRRVASVRLVSMPCTTTFDRAGRALTGTACCRPPCVRRVAVEAGATQPWWRYVGTRRPDRRHRPFRRLGPARNCSSSSASRPSTCNRRSTTLAA